MEIPLAQLVAAPFLDICLKFDTNGQLSTRLYDKREDFNFSYYKLSTQGLDSVVFFVILLEIRHINCDLYLSLE